MRARIMRLTLGLGAVALFAAAASGAFASGAPARSIYPPAVPARHGGALEACPNTAGLVRFEALADGRARAAALQYGLVSEPVDLANSDRAWQREVRSLWKGLRAAPPRAETRVVRAVIPAAKSEYQVIVRGSCGEAIVRRSLIVTIAPATPVGQRPCQGCAENLLFVDRRGHALIYFVY